MLTRKDWITISVGGALVAGLAGGGELFTGDQFSRLVDLRRKVASAVTPSAAADIVEKKKQLKARKQDAIKWTKLLATAEKVFPKSQTSVITNVDLAALVSSTSANLVKCDKGRTTELSWSPPAPAEGTPEGDGSEPDPKVDQVKYSEDVLNVRLRGDYDSWLKILVGIEEMRKFYRFKDLTMTSTLGARPDQPPLTIDLQLASYRVLEWPSDRKPAEASGE